MIKENHKIVIIGGGPAGLAAAISAKENGCDDVIIIERDRILGGILNQCIHDGFGLAIFKEALSGPEYAHRYIQKVKELGIKVLENTIVLDLSQDKKLITSREGEIKEIQAEAVILAMGCRERARGALSIPGDRPSGVYTAGTVQNLINLENIMPGKKVCILGSGDIGLIMARRMTLEGAKVEAVFEVLPYPSGLQRNIRQCLIDYDIPLYLKTTVTNIHGENGRLVGVTVSEVDDGRQPIEGTERFVPCDTLLLSVGLIPENELSREAGIPLSPITQGAEVDDTCMTEKDGIFACGNVLHVHDVVDFVSREAEKAGKNAANYIQGKREKTTKEIKVKPGFGIRYIVPQKITSGKDVSLFFRVYSPMPQSDVEILANGKVIKKFRPLALNPSEMHTVKIGNIDIENIDTMEVQVKW
ncbi:MAG: FAD-dependent oxidoreductase [Synergistaceae bacterium]